MSKEREANMLRNANGISLQAPPGFVSLTAFSLKRIQEIDENGNSKACLKQDPVQKDAVDRMSNSATLDTYLRKRPWILFEPTNNEPAESDLEQSEDQDFPSEICLPKGVIHGYPDRDSLKVTARWRPEDARKDVVEDAPVFYPTEEEFKDSLKYIATISPKAKSFGICRISPPASWNPPCVLKEEKIWKGSKFVTQVQRVDGLQVPYSKGERSFVEDVNGKRRRTLGRGNTAHAGEAGVADKENFELARGPEFTLESFEKYADDFKSQYFCKSEVTSLNHFSATLHEILGPSVEDVEAEYKRIVDAPTEEIEVLSCDGPTAEALGSGFPTASKPSHPEIVNSSWNLNNVPTRFGSLLSFESSDTCRILTPQVRIGMCFSALNWRVEEHHLYSLWYSHKGALKVWYAVPQRDGLKFQRALKSSSADVLEKTHRPAKHLLPSALKSEGVPVFRCVQNPREFVLVFPGAYHSGFDSGFNCSEKANLAPLDWLPHGHNALELYRDLGRKTALSHDKLLLRAASEAARAQWDLSLRRNITSDNQFWKDACGKEGILTKAFKARVKSEETARKFLCSSSRARSMNEKFDATVKRECKICLSDLHFSAAGCPCSADTFSCLNHANRLCGSCGSTGIFFLFRHDIDDLNLLARALEGNLSSVFKWVKGKLGLSLNSQASEDRQPSPVEKSGQKIQKSPKDSASSIRAEIKARLLQSILSNKSKAKAKAPATPVFSGRNLTSGVDRGNEPCVSESTNFLNRTGPKPKTAAPAPGSMDKDCSFPEIEAVLGTSEMSSEEEFEGDESD